MTDNSPDAAANSRRIDPFRTADDALKALAVFGGGGHARTLDPELVVLARMRVAQMNDSAYGIEMVAREAARLSSPETRFAALADWRAGSEFSDREKAALGWVEAVTHFAETRVPDEIYDHARSHFPGDELVALTVAAVSANAWCQIAVSFRLSP
jgi:alkylhydroperoxidase family enzyme